MRRAEVQRVTLLLLPAAVAAAVGPQATVVALAWVELAWAVSPAPEETEALAASRAAGAGPLPPEEGRAAAGSAAREE